MEVDCLGIQVQRILIIGPIAYHLKAKADIVYPIPALAMCPFTFL